VSLDFSPDRSARFERYRTTSTARRSPEPGLVPGATRCKPTSSATTRRAWRHLQQWDNSLTVGERQQCAHRRRQTRPHGVAGDMAISLLLRTPRCSIPRRPRAHYRLCTSSRRRRSIAVRRPADELGGSTRTTCDLARTSCTTCTRRQDLAGQRVKKFQSALRSALATRRERLVLGHRTNDWARHPAARHPSQLNPVRRPESRCFLGSGRSDSALATSFQPKLQR